MLLALSRRHSLFGNGIFNTDGSDTRTAAAIVYRLSQSLSIAPQSQTSDFPHELTIGQAHRPQVQARSFKLCIKPIMILAYEAVETDTVLTYEAWKQIQTMLRPGVIKIHICVS